MAMAHNLVAVGSQSHISMLDPRLAQPVIRTDVSIDPGQVRLHTPINVVVTHAWI